jgi:hypothetical protein
MCKTCGYFNWLTLTVICVLCVLYLLTLYDKTTSREEMLLEEISWLEYEIQILAEENQKLFKAAKANGYD